MPSVMPAQDYIELGSGAVGPQVIRQFITSAQRASGPRRRARLHTRRQLGARIVGLTGERDGSARSERATDALTVRMLAKVAKHSEWANQRVFAACAQVAPEKLTQPGDGYDSVLGILNHLVQVENAFFELAHDRTPRWTAIDDLGALQARCARIDRAYVDYADSIDPTEAETRRFLVPWFGFEITAAEGLIQPLTHSHKHRSDVSMLLPHLGGEGIEMDFIQWLDEVRGAR